MRRPFLDHRPGPDGFGGFFVVHGHTPNDARREASHADQIAGFRLNLDAGSAMTGVAKMAMIRDRYAEVVSARGPTKRELTGISGFDSGCSRGWPILPAERGRTIRALIATVRHEIVCAVE